jgi:hypothetical protein
MRMLLRCQYLPCAVSGKGRLHVGKNLSSGSAPRPTAPTFLRNTLWKLVLQLRYSLTVEGANQERLLTDSSTRTDVNRAAPEPESVENQRM